MAKVADQCQFLERWVSYYKRSAEIAAPGGSGLTTTAARGAGGGGAEGGGEEGGKREGSFRFQEAGDLSAAALRRLRRVGSFLHSCLCVLVMRDLCFLVERYLRKTRKSFTRVPELLLPRGVRDND